MIVNRHLVFICSFLLISPAPQADSDHGCCGIFWPDEFEVMFGLPLVLAKSFSPSVPFADAGTYAATKLAATPLPEVKRNLRRVGLGGRDFGSSSDIRSVRVKNVR